MIAHGSTRNTFDIDVAIARDRDNAGRLVRALAPLNPRPRGFPSEIPFIWDESSVRSMTIATLTTSAGDLDILAEPEGVDDFEGLWQRAIESEITGHIVKIASIDDLVAMKQAANRDKDREDLRYLAIIRQ